MLPTLEPATSFHLTGTDTISMPRRCAKYSSSTSKHHLQRQQRPQAFALRLSAMADAVGQHQSATSDSGGRERRRRLKRRRADRAMHAEEL
jgi:hypothetical protein